MLFPACAGWSPIQHWWQSPHHYVSVGRSLVNGESTRCMKNRSYCIANNPTSVYILTEWTHWENLTDCVQWKKSGLIIVWDGCVNVNDCWCRRGCLLYQKIGGCVGVMSTDKTFYQTNLKIEKNISLIYGSTYYFHTIHTCSIISHLFRTTGGIILIYTRIISVNRGRICSDEWGRFYSGRLYR